MDVLVAGLASGALMAQTFIAAGCLTVFFLLKDPPPSVAPLLSRFPPGTLVLGIVAAAFPTWGILGVVLAFLFLALENGVPGSGLGSANIAYSLGITVAAVALAAPFLLLLRRVWPGVTFITVASALIYGWLLPFLAT